MRRRIIGILAIVSLAVTVVLSLMPAGHGYEGIEPFTSRLGAVMAVWWLAYPDLRRLPPWMLVGILIMLVLMMWRPGKFLLLFIPVLIVLAILRPRWGRRKSGRQP